MGTPYIPERYAEQLRAAYPAMITDQIEHGLQEVPLAAQPGEVLPYLAVQPGMAEHDRPLLYVPGFSEDVINKISFAAELAVQGVAAIVPGQNRRGLLRDEFNKRSSLHSQAHNYLGLIDEVAGDAPIDIVTHSFGAQVFEAMTKLAPQRFNDSRAILLAPSGTIHDEGFRSLGKHWLQMIRSESDSKRPMEFPDNDGVSGQASLRTLRANVIRTGYELKDLAKRRIDYSALIKRVGSLTVMSFAEDAMFPTDAMYPTMDEAVQAGATWLTPVDLRRVVKGELSYGGQAATHDDEQFNPSRVVGAIKSILAD